MIITHKVISKSLNMSGGIKHLTLFSFSDMIND